MKNIFLILIILSGINCSGSIIAQQMDSPFAFPQYDYLLVPSFKGEQIAVTVYVKSSYDNLIFSNNQIEYEALFSVDYEFSSDSIASRVYRGDSNNNISVRDFTETNAQRKFTIISDEISISPADYLFKLKGYTQNGRKTLFNYEDSLLWREKEGFWFAQFFLQKANGNPYIGRDKYRFGLNGKFVIPIHWQPNAKPDSLGFFLYTKVSRELVGRKVTDEIEDKELFFIPGQFEDLPEGDYKLYVIAYRGRKIVSKYEKEFSVVWFGKPWSLQKLGLAMKPLSVVMNQADYNYIVNSDNLSESFADYWKKIDPTPESEFNEIMAEFYIRADIVHRAFGSERDYGWSAARGAIYLQFGKPDNIIDNSLHHTGQGYIVWEYLSADKEITFIHDGSEYKLKSIKQLSVNIDE